MGKIRVPQDQRTYLHFDSPYCQSQTAFYAPTGINEYLALDVPEYAAIFITKVINGKIKLYAPPIYL